MGTPISRGYMCCSVRDKHAVGSQHAAGDQMTPVCQVPRFQVKEADIAIESAKFASFAPLHHREPALPRRIVLANNSELHVYTVLDGDPDMEGENFSVRFQCAHVMSLESEFMITGAMFVDEDNSRNIAVALAPVTDTASAAIGIPRAAAPANDAAAVPTGPVVRIWSVENFAAMQQDEVLHIDPYRGFLASLGEHKRPIEHMAVNRSFLVTADGSGECCVWQKNRAFSRQTVSIIHADGLAHLIVDRLHVFSIGKADRRICIWGLPSLVPLLEIPVDIPAELFADISPSKRPPSTETTPHIANNGFLQGDQRLARLSFMCRPSSRWAGMPGSTRLPKVPRGTLLLAGVLGDGAIVAGPGAGVLMSYAMWPSPICTGVQIAHDSPIVALVYGPYDNGPVVTADAKGVFRIWESPEKGFHLTQQIDGTCSSFPADFAIAVEPPYGIYVAIGTKKMMVWRR